MGFWRCVLYLAGMGIVFFPLGRILPKEWFHADAYPYRSYAFERDGKIYEKLRIKRWQNKVPDMSKVLPGLMPAKAMAGRSFDRLPLMIRETCVAEFIHRFHALLGLRCFAIWPGMGGALIALLNILLLNLPFILIQRYNRPRMLRLMRKQGIPLEAVSGKQEGGQYACADTQL